MASFQCPGCKSWLQVGEDFAGRKIRCGRCQAVADVPAAAAPGPDAPTVAHVPAPREAMTERAGGLPPPPAREPRRRERNDDDWPRRRRDPEADRDNSSSAVLIAVLVAGGAVALVILAVVVLGVFFFLAEAPVAEGPAPVADAPDRVAVAPAPAPGDGPMAPVPPVEKIPQRPPLEKLREIPPIEKLPPVLPGVMPGEVQGKDVGEPKPPPLDGLRTGKFVQPPPSRAPTYYLYVVSSPGDFVGQGQTYSYRGNEVRVRTNPRGVEVRANGWNLLCGAAPGWRLTVGEFRGARRHPFSGASPGIEFTGNGRGCNTIAGEFRVWELEVRGNEVVRLAIDFVQRCEETGPPLYGAVRFNSSFQ
jgi:hypothetical protein